VEVGALLPSLGFKDFHHAAQLQSPASGHLEGCPPALWWREASRTAASPPPRPQLQGCSSSSLGWKARPSWGPAFHMGWRPASSFSIRGRRAFTSLAEEANFGYVGPAGCRHRQLSHVWLLGLDGFGTASGAASCRLVGAWLFVHRTDDSRAVRRFATSTASPAPPAALL
jgi:hypothetical protein